MEFDPTKLREFLTIMREFHVDKCEFSGIKIEFKLDSTPAAPFTPETSQDRLERIKGEFINASRDAETDELWSA